MPYAALPGRRVPYDVTGYGWNYSTYLSGGSWIPFTPTELLELNDDDGTVVYTNGSGFLTLAFAIGFGLPVTLKGLFICSNHTNGPAYTLYTSTDTINGADGTWSSAGTFNVHSSWGAWRGSITSITPVSSCTGIRIVSPGGSGGSGGTLWSIHAYGDYSYSGLNTWHPTEDRVLTGPEWDFGDTIRGYTYTKTFKIRNSSAQTANGVVVGTSFPYEASPTLASQVTFSDGGAYASTINIGNLIPGATSSVLTCKYALPVNAQTGPWSGRITSTATSWT